MPSNANLISIFATYALSRIYLFQEIKVRIMYTSCVTNAYVILQKLKIFYCNLAGIKGVNINTEKSSTKRKVRVVQPSILKIMQFPMLAFF